MSKLQSFPARFYYKKERKRQFVYIEDESKQDSKNKSVKVDNTQRVILSGRSSRCGRFFEVISHFGVKLFQRLFGSSDSLLLVRSGLLLRSSSLFGLVGLSSSSSSGLVGGGLRRLKSSGQGLLGRIHDKFNLEELVRERKWIMVFGLFPTILYNTYLHNSLTINGSSVESVGSIDSQPRLGKVDGENTGSLAFGVKRGLNVSDRSDFRRKIFLITWLVNEDTR